jgi:hypothetical protein
LIKNISLSESLDPIFSKLWNLIKYRPVLKQNTENIVDEKDGYISKKSSTV